MVNLSEPLTYPATGTSAASPGIRTTTDSSQSFADELFQELPSSGNAGAAASSVLSALSSQINAPRQDSVAQAAPGNQMLAGATFGFNALIPVTPAAAATVTAAATVHPYASNPIDDAYWAKQPAAVQQLREVSDPDQRSMLAGQLASEGYTIDVPVMVWGWDAGITTALRQSYGYTWVPSAMQSQVTAAPGLSGGGITPYDPNNPPSGAILVG